MSFIEEFKKKLIEVCDEMDKEGYDKEEEFIHGTTYIKLIKEFLKDLKTINRCAEEPSLNPDLTFSFKNYADLTNELYKKWEKKLKEVDIK